MSFLATKGFLVGATVAAFVVAGSSVAWYASTNGGAFAFTTSDCGAVVGGRDLGAAREDTGLIGDAPRRLVTYTVDASSLVGGDVRACSSVGDVEVTTSDDGTASVVFEIRSEHATERARERVAEAVVRAALVDEDGGLLLVAAHEPTRENDENLVVQIRIVVPASGPYAFHLATGVGDLHLDGFEVSRVDATTGVGDIDVFDLRTRGDVVLHTGVGDVETDLAPLASGRVAVQTGTGDLRVFAAGTPDVGFDVVAATGVGRVDVDVGPTETRESQDSTVGDSVRTRSEGYASKSIQVQVEARTGVGDVSVAS